MHRFSWKLAVIGLVVLTGCHPEFQLKKFTTNEALYQASLRQFERGKWSDAVAGFEKLTLELAPRDTLAPKSFWYLGLARQHQHDLELAAQSFNRIFESFPDDTLAEYALFQEARSYQQMWTRPDRDATFGDAALTTYSSLSTYYPNTKLRDAALKEVAALQAMFAEKNYATGMYYFRDKALDSGIPYFKEVFETWPDAPKARDAGLRMVDTYRILGYKEEVADVCGVLRTRYPTDAEVAKTCPAPLAPVKTDTVGVRTAAH